MSGIGLVIVGIWGGGKEIATFGGGLSASSLVMSALRLITNTNITFSSAGYTSQYTAPDPVIPPTL